MNADSYLTLASIFAGFGVTVLMFRIQRELHVREKFPNAPNWIAWADYLILGAIFLALVFVVLPLLVLGTGDKIQVVAAASCAAAAVLLAAYPFAILAHYRLRIGEDRKGLREEGEPIEKTIVIAAYLLAAGLFGALVLRALCVAFQ